MPNIKSAAKRVLTSGQARERNRSVRAAIHTARRAFLAAVASKDKGKSMSAFQALVRCWIRRRRRA